MTLPKAAIVLHSGHYITRRGWIMFWITHYTKIQDPTFRCNVIMPTKFQWSPSGITHTRELNNYKVRNELWRDLL